MKHVIVTGFDPFDKLKFNPSMDVVRNLEDFEDFKLYPVILPTVYGECSKILISKIIEVKPDAAISLGLATGRKKITLERFALNMDDAKTRDNKGEKRRGCTISEGGNSAYLSGLPLNELINALRRYKIKSDISNFCGTFVCNHLMYNILHHINANLLPVKYGFIHLPKVSAKGINLEKMIKAVKIIIKTTLPAG